jgi:hypothetical protein
VSVRARIRSLEARAQVRSRAARVCQLCGGKGKPNSRTIGPFDTCDERPLEPCPGCGKVDLTTIVLSVGSPITPIHDLSRAVLIERSPAQI